LVEQARQAEAGGKLAFFPVQDKFH
jgi:hypothetical protein